MALSSAAFVIAMLADAAAAKPSATPARDPDKLVCRREVETGSLVKSRRTCHTRKEWAELANAGQRDAQTMADRAGPRATSGGDFTPF